MKNGRVYLIAAIAILLLYRSLISPIILAAIIAFFFNPLVTWLKGRFNWTHNRAVNSTFSVLLLSLTIFIVLIIPIAIAQGRNIENILLQLEGVLLEMQGALSDIVGFGLPLSDGFTEVFAEWQALTDSDRLFPLIQSASTNAIWAIIILVTSYYLMRDWHIIRDKFFALFEGAQGARVEQAYLDIKSVLQSYLRGQITLMLLVGLMTWLAGSLLGLRGAIFIALLSGFLNIVPSIGPVVAAIVAIFVAFQAGSSVLPISNALFALLTLVVFVLVQQVEMLWLQPAVMKKRLNIHPAISLLAIVGTLFQYGTVAAILILPLIGIGQILFRLAQEWQAGFGPPSE